MNLNYDMIYDLCCSKSFIICLVYFIIIYNLFYSQPTNKEKDWIMNDLDLSKIFIIYLSIIFIFNLCIYFSNIPKPQ